jgi:hypothetical protein
MMRLLNSLIFRRRIQRKPVRRPKTTAGQGTPMILSFDGRVVRLRQPD